jgi:protein phosphatase
MSEPKMTSDMVVVGPAETETASHVAGALRLTVQSFGLTDRGKKRETNEDQFLIAELLKALRITQTSLPQPQVQHGGERAYLFVVADGMGGHAGGEKASALALDSVESFIHDNFKWFFRVKGHEEDKVLAEFQSALGRANARVLAEAADHRELRGMGTTLTLAYSLDGFLFVAHVGDSRCYLSRAGTLYRLTKDHTMAEELVQRGVISPEEALHNHWRHVITNAVGGDSPEISVELHKLRLEAGDRVLLCSDGLTNMVNDDHIARILHFEADPATCGRELVHQANEAGGGDNITVVVAHFLNDPQAL